MKTAVIFGGTGFIGTFFAKYLLESSAFKCIYLYDLEDIDFKSSQYRKDLVCNDSRIKFIKGDIRSQINIEDLHTKDNIDLIANFAAIHREPGHADKEYYETNLAGANNVCEWADKIGCNNIIFTSSIAPYGPSEDEKDEQSLTTPTTAYGGSKLVAENIHKTWQAKDSSIRRLIIARPGVVYGPGEGGNVSRLIKAVINRYFFYMGNKNTRKAGVYVKELCNAMYWVMYDLDNNPAPISLFNVSMNPGPSINEYVLSICKVAHIKRSIFSVPYILLYTASLFIELFAKPFGLSHPFSPVRIKKLVKSNNILPSYLVDKGYKYKYNLDESLSDWRDECPAEWK